MKISDPFPKLIVGILTLALLAISCQKKPVKVAIEYDKAVGTISLEGKVINSYLVNFNKDLTEKDAKNLAKLLTDATSKTLDFENLIDMGEGILALKSEKDPSASFELDIRSGNFLYNGGLSEYKNDDNTSDLIVKDSAEAMALGHLEKLDLFPDKQELNLVKIGGLNMAVLKEDSTTEVFRKLVTVRYDRKLTDVPVMGDSRIIANLGAKGELAGLIYYWGEIVEKRKIEPRDLLTDKQIKKKLEESLRKASGDAKKILVQQADFVYYDDGKGYIEPAYYVLAMRTYEIPSSERGKLLEYESPYDYYIPVLKKPLAFYPFMETAKEEPKDLGEDKIVSQDDE